MLNLVGSVGHNPTKPSKVKPSQCPPEMSQGSVSWSEDHRHAAVLGQDRSGQGRSSLEGQLVTKKSLQNPGAGSEGPCVQLLQLLSLQGIKPQSTEATLALSQHIKNDSRSTASPSLLPHPPCHPYFSFLLSHLA